jgi:transposase
VIKTSNNVLAADVQILMQRNTRYMNKQGNMSPHKIKNFPVTNTNDNEIYEISEKEFKNYL